LEGGRISAASVAREAPWSAVAQLPPWLRAERECLTIQCDQDIYPGHSCSALSAKPARQLRDRKARRMSGAISNLNTAGDSFRWQSSRSDHF